MKLTKAIKTRFNSAINDFMGTINVDYFDFGNLMPVVLKINSTVVNPKVWRIGDGVIIRHDSVYLLHAGFRATQVIGTGRNRATDLLTAIFSVCAEFSIWYELNGKNNRATNS